VILRRNQPFYRRQPVLILGAGLVLIAMAVVGGFLLFGNNDDDGDVVTGAVKEKIPTESTSGTPGGPDTISRMPPSSVSLLIEEMPPNYEVDVPNSFLMTVSTFSSSYWFKSDAEGRQLAEQWRIVGGYQVYYQPKGLAAEALQGVPYVRIETYVFADVDGAKKAWGHLDALMKRTAGSEAVEARPLANDWSAYRYFAGTVGTSETVAVYHRFSFRRGNTIVSVQTWGADPFLNIDPARNIAAAIDDKLLGTRPAVEPTPIPTPSFPGLGN